MMPRWKKITLAVIAVLWGIFLVYSLVLGDVPTGKDAAGEGELAAAEETLPCQDLEETFQGNGEWIHEVGLRFTDVPKDGGWVKPPDRETVGEVQEDVQWKAKDAVVMEIWTGEDMIWAGRLSGDTIREDQVARVYLNLPLEKGKTYRMKLTSDGPAPRIYVGDSSACPLTDASLTRGGEKLAGQVIASGITVHRTAGAGERILWALYWLPLFLALGLAALFPERLGAWIGRVEDRLLRPGAWRLLCGLIALLLGLLAFNIPARLAASDFGQGLIRLVLAEENHTLLAAIALTALTALCALILRETWAAVKRQMQVRWHWAVLLGLILCTGIAINGSSTLVLPLEEPWNHFAILRFFAGSLVGIPWIALAIWGAEKLTLWNNAPLSGQRMPAGWFIAIALAFMLIPAAIFLIAYNPMISSPDSAFVLQEAMGDHPLEDWQPLLWIGYVKLAMSLGGHVTAIAITNWIFWSFVTLRGFLYLREKGMKDGLLLAAAFLIGFNPANALILDTAWKDVPFACSLLWLCICVAKIMLDGEKYRQRTGLWVEMAFAMVGVIGFRHNGIVVFVLALLILAFFCKGRKRWLTVALSVCLTFILFVPLPQMLDVQESKDKVSNKYTGFAADDTTVYYSGGKLTEETLRFVTMSTRYDNQEFEHEPTYFRYFDLREAVDFTMGEFLVFQTKSILKNPLSFVRAGMARNNLTWSLFDNSGSPVYTAVYTQESPSDIWFDYAPHRKWTPLTRLCNTGLHVCQMTVFPLYWRCGIWAWAILFALALGLMGRRRAALLVTLIPFGHVLGLWLASGYGNEFRFMWPLNVMAPFMILLIPLLWKPRQKEKDPEDDHTDRPDGFLEEEEKASAAGARRSATMISTLGEIIRYGIAGVSTTVLCLGVYWALTAFFLDPRNAIQLQIANVASWVIAVIYAYIINRRFVFGSKSENVAGESGAFFLSRLGTLGLDMALMFLLVTVAGINDRLVKLFVQVVVALTNYLVGKFVVFRKGSRRPGRPLPLGGAGKHYLWGGSRLQEEYGQEGDAPLAERWVCSTHPDGPSPVIGGSFEGMTLKEVVERFPQCLGEGADAGGDLPVLVKLIDAREDLSLQVHPDDDYARIHENGQRGKMEMWYVLEAAPGAFMRSGFLEDTDREKVKEALEKGSLITRVRRVPVRPDDVLLIPAGTIHAGGAGTVFAEIQENSDLTYRLYDYDRRDARGELRPLHVDKALDVLDYGAGKWPRQPMRQITCHPGLSWELVQRCPSFEVRRIRIHTQEEGKPADYAGDARSFRILLCIDGGGELHCGPETHPIAKGACFFVPAGSEPSRITGRAAFLEIVCRGNGLYG